MPTMLDRVAEIGVVPVIAIDSVAHALPLADALLAGGLPVVEITFRTAAAEAVIRLLAKERPALTVGAGTVLSPETVKTAAEAGARFAVAPGLNPRVVQAAQDLGLPFVPGIANPSDIEAGLELGCTLLKFFPTEALGGTRLLSALSAPYRHTGARFMPTGGVSPSNLEAYLKIDTVAAVGGTWIAKQEDMAAGRWDAIAQRCRDACARRCGSSATWSRSSKPMGQHPGPSGVSQPQNPRLYRRFSISGGSTMGQQARKSQGNR